METAYFTSDIKKNNRNRVYRFLHEYGPATKKEMSASMNMSMPTLIQNLRELEEKNLVVRAVSEGSRGGRRPETVTCNLGAKIALGVDITKKHIAVIAVDLGANVLAHKRIYERFENTELYFRKLSLVVREFILDNRLLPENVLGAGVSLPGILAEDSSRLLFGNVIDFDGQSLRKFSDALGYPCLFSNDASAAGLAEFSSIPGLKNAIYLYLSNSVGGAIMMNGELCSGDNNKSAELGHMCVVPDGKRCYCGHDGCLNAYCSASVLAEAAGGKLEDFFEKLAAGDALCRGAWEEYKSHLTLAIRNLRTMFDCDIIIGGYVGSCMGGYFQEIRDALSHNQLFEENAVFVRPCRYQVEAAALGAALMHVRAFLNEI